MSEPETPPETKLTRTKRLWAEAGKFLVGRRSRPEDERLPPGQHLVKDWPVLDLGIVPAVPPDRFRLDVDGLVRNRLSLDWDAFQALRQTTLRSDIHCVTSWSRYDNDWTGVLARELMARADPLPEAGHVILHGSCRGAASLLLEERQVAEADRGHRHRPGRILERNGYHMYGDPWCEQRYG